MRKPSDPIRARGGFKSERSLREKEFTFTKDLSGIVIESKPEYSLMALNEGSEHDIIADIEGQADLLDAGIPHYRWIGVHMKNPLTIGGTERLCNKKIRTVKAVHSNMGLVECNNLIFKSKGKLGGLCLYYYPFSNPLVKIIPPKPYELALKISEKVSVAIS